MGVALPEPPFLWSSGSPKQTDEEREVVVDLEVEAHIEGERVEACVEASSSRELDLLDLTDLLGIHGLGSLGGRMSLKLACMS
mmetsp:Transcript_34151/g.92466  ORF Transcript_34151/g.92466 Transcript_34151/m.92466 type:complete len:83 (+) Transcript_34151:111-359(+)